METNESNKKNMNHSFFEGMISYRSIIESLKNNITFRKIIAVYVNDEKKHKIKNHLSYIKAMSYELNYEIKYVKEEEINSLARGNTHGGIITECTVREYKQIRDYIFDTPRTCVYLDGIEDPFNLGYSIRSLYAFGINDIIINSRSWSNFESIIQTSSAGTYELTNIYKLNNYQDLKIFKDHGYKIITTGINNSVPIEKANLTVPSVIVIGGEKRGISAFLEEISDLRIRIDYNNNYKLSLSASSAAVIIGYEYSKQIKLIHN